MLETGPFGVVDGDPQRESQVLIEILGRQKQQLSLPLFAIKSSRRRQDEEPVT